jgi:hypothetical protein
MLESEWKSFLFLSQGRLLRTGQKKAQDPTLGFIDFVLTGLQSALALELLGFEISEFLI